MSNEEETKKEMIEEEMLDDVALDKRLDKQWNIQKIWNEQLISTRDNRKLEPRDYMWATEIGMSYFDRWHKMNGIEAEKKYSPRLLRKFEVGNIFEKMIGFVANLSGILVDEQERIEIPATDKTLKITGYSDYKLGGKPKDWEEIKNNDFTKLYFKFFPQYENIAKAINKLSHKNYSAGIPIYIYEVKTINSMLFWAKKDYIQEAYKHHRLQLLTYLKAKGIKEGRIIYISKDDMTIIEMPVYLNEKTLNEEWQKDVEEMTAIYKSGEKPDVPPLIVFDKRKKINFTFEKKKYFITGSYTENWQIKWSNYITQMGFKDEDDFMRQAHQMVLDGNNEIKENYKNKNGLIKIKK